MDAVYCTQGNIGGFVAFTDDFKRRLNHALEKSGITMRSLAAACNVSPPTVTKWMDESDPVTPELKKLPIICRTLNVSASFLIHGDESMAPESSNIAKARDLAIEIASLLGKSGTSKKRPAKLNG